MAFVQGRVVEDATSGTSTALAYTGALTSGTFLIALVAWNSSSLTASVSDSVNGAWTALGSPFTGVSGLASWRAQLFALAGNAATSAATVTATISGTVAQRRLAIHEYSNVATYDAPSYANATNTTGTHTCPSVTPGLSTDQVFEAVVSQAAITTVDAPFTIRETAHLGTADVGSPTAGTGYAAVFHTSTGGWDGIGASIVLHAPAAPSGGARLRALLGVGS